MKISVNPKVKFSLESFKESFGHAFKTIPEKDRDKAIKDAFHELVPEKNRKKDRSRRSSDDNQDKEASD